MNKISKEVESEMRLKVFKVLSYEMQTLGEISEAANISLRACKTVITELVNQNLIKYAGSRPVRYALLPPRKNNGPAVKEEWKGFPMPYMRPGSYETPKPKISMLSKVNHFNPYLADK